MIIGIPVYQGVDLLDVTGPYEVLSWVENGIDVRLISRKANDVIITRDKKFTFLAPFGFNDVPSLDVLWVPGGDPDALKNIMSGPDGDYLDFMKDRSKNAKWVCSVCEGALLLAKAGLLDGYECTTHWLSFPA
jgi:putative intracellular protease/amidase